MQLVSCQLQCSWSAASMQLVGQPIHSLSWPAWPQPANSPPGRSLQSICLKATVQPEHPLTIGRLPRAPQQGCQCLIAIEGAKLQRGTPDPDSAYWN